MAWEPNIEITTDEMHRFFLREAYKYAYRLSDDPMTKVGAEIVKKTLKGYIVIGYGVNHIPHSVDETIDDCSSEGILSLLTDRNWKINSIHHAERAAIQWTREVMREDPREKTMYMPWIPCDSCADEIIAAGIIELIGHKQMILKTPERWHESTNKAIEKLKQENIKLLMYDGSIGGAFSVFNGEVWQP